MENNENAQMRQGDVYLVRLDEAPDVSDMKEIEPKGGKQFKGAMHVLAYGEVTGHMHALPAQNARLFQAALGTILLVDQAVTLRHGDPMKAWQGDHHDVEIPPGAYKVTIDREYEPSGWRQVAD